jgi:hypothetical protein
MKKTWIYLLGLTLSIGITACGNASTETESPATDEMEMDTTDDMEAESEEAIDEAEAANPAPAATPTTSAPQAKATESAHKAVMNKKEAANTSSDMISDDAPVAVEQPKKAVTNATND